MKEWNGGGARGLS